MRHTRNIIFTLTIAVFSLGFSTPLENLNGFEIEQGNLVWSQIVTSDMTPEELLSSVMRSSIEVKSKTQSSIIGFFSNLGADYKGAGYSEMKTPIYVSRYLISGNIAIDIKPGRYRVRLTDIMLEKKYSDALSKQGEKSTLDSYAIKSNGVDFRGMFLKAPADIYNHTFSQEFTFTKVNDDW